jgi:colicin import membrane protein
MENKRQGFVLSIMLHVVVVAGMLLFALVEPPEKPPKTVFNLVSPPPPSPTPADAVETPTPQVRLPEFPPIPEPPKPRPPERQPEPPRQRPPDPPKPVVPVKKPTVTPKPKPPPAPQEAMSIEEWQKLQKPRKPPAPTTPPPKKPAPPPRVDTKFTVKLSDTLLDVDGLVLTDAQQSALDSYIARLLGALKRAWDVPPSATPSTQVFIEVTVAPGGNLTGARISKSSGNAQFDQSALDTFRAIGSAGPTPDGRQLRLRLPFRIEE